MAELKGGITKGQRRRPGQAVRSVPYLRVANVQRGFLDLTEVKRIEATEEEIAELQLREGDVLFNEGGDRDKLGRGWVWQGQLPVCIHQNHVFRARLYSGALSPKYLSWYANSEGQDYFIAQGKQTTNLASLNLTKLGELPVKVPPAEEQRRIVAAIDEQLTRLDAAVASLKRARANLKRYRARVLQAAVEGRLAATEVPLTLAAERTCATGGHQLARTMEELRLETGRNVPMTLPSGWAWGMVGQIGRVQLGRQRSPKNRSDRFPTRYIRAANITWDGLDLRDVLEMEFLPKEREVYRLLPGDVVLNEASGSPDEVGKPALWRGELSDCCFQNTVIRFRPIIVKPEYALTVFRHYALNGTFARASRGVGIHHLGAERFSTLPFPFPPVEEQERIVAEVERRLSAVEAVETAVDANLKRAERLRQAVLKRAFEGELVPQDPSDEPASVLLERIRALRRQDEASPAPRRRRPVWRVATSTERGAIQLPLGGE
jgi:type I restriction enzyme S subunit